MKTYSKKQETTHYNSVHAMFVYPAGLFDIWREIVHIYDKMLQWTLTRQQNLLVLSSAPVIPPCSPLLVPLTPAETDQHRRSVMLQPGPPHLPGAARLEPPDITATFSPCEQAKLRYTHVIQPGIERAIPPFKPCITENHSPFCFISRRTAPITGGHRGLIFPIGVQMSPANSTDTNRTAARLNAHLFSLVWGYNST